MYQLGKYKYFDFLVEINNHYLQEVPTGTNVRESNEANLNLLNTLLEEFFDNLSLANSLDEIITLSLNLAGFFVLRQPFYDGNSRTMKAFLVLVFKQYHYKIKLPKDNEQLIIPLFYYDNEKCTNTNIENFKRLLIKTK